MRQTRQREHVLAVLQAAEGPLPVEQIHERARQALPRLGIATVYRTLKLLLAQGQIVTVAFPGEEPHYEPAGRGHHHHFRCRNCARWFELQTCLVPHLEQLTLREGYVIEAHELTLYGRCPQCTSPTKPSGAP